MNSNIKKHKKTTFIATAVLLVIVLLSTVVYMQRMSVVADNKLKKDLKVMASSEPDCSVLMKRFGHEKASSDETRELLLTVFITCYERNGNYKEASEYLGEIERLYTSNEDLYRHIDVGYYKEILKKKPDTKDQEAANRDGQRNEDGSYAGP